MISFIMCYEKNTINTLKWSIHSPMDCYIVASIIQDVDYKCVSIPNL